MAGNPRIHSTLAARLLLGVSLIATLLTPELRSEGTNELAGKLQVCDSLKTRYIMDVIFGGGSLPGWEEIGIKLRDDPRTFRLFRMQMTPGGYVDDWIVSRDVYWEAFQDTVTVVVYSRVDLEALMDYALAVTPQYCISHHAVFIRNLATEAEILASVLLDDVVFGQLMSDEPHGTSVDQLELTGLGIGQNNLLRVTMSLDQMGASDGYSETCEGFWRWDGERSQFIPLTSVSLGNHRMRGDRGSPTFAPNYSLSDVDQDGQTEVVYRRNYDWLWAGNTATCSDPGDIIWEYTNDQLQPDRMAQSNESPIKLRPQLPLLLFPPHFTDTIVADSVAAKNLRSLDGFVAEASPIFKTYLPFRSSEYPPKVWDEHSYCQLRLESDSLRIVVLTGNNVPGSYRDHSTPAPDYDLAFWFDSDIEGDFEDSTCSEDDILFLAHSDPNGSSLKVSQYRLSQTPDVPVLETENQLAMGTLVRNEWGRNYSVTLPLDRLRLQRDGDVTKLCGFGMEIYKSGVFPDSSRVRLICAYPSSFDHSNPTTWGMLMIACRRDSLSSDTSTK